MRRLSLLLTGFFWCVISVSPGHTQDVPSAAVTEYNYPTEWIAVPSWRFAHGPHVRSAFREVVADARLATVEVLVDGSRVALGGIIDSAGWVVTKASVLGKNLTCRLSDGRELNAHLIGSDHGFDIALLWVEATGLPALQLADTASPKVGTWLATVSTDRYPLGVGVVSVEPRKVARRPGVLGVQLDAENERARIVRVFPDSAAALAGLVVGDVLLAVNGKAAATREDLIAQIRHCDPGDRVQIEVDRSGTQLTVTATLMGWIPDLLFGRNEFQNRLGGELSQRRFGFPSAFQHDTVIEPSACGGPVLNLAGDVVGFNVARSGRTETYAIATSAVTKLVKKMMPQTPLPEYYLTGKDAADAPPKTKPPTADEPLAPSVPSKVP